MAVLYKILYNYVAILAQEKLLQSNLDANKNEETHCTKFQ
jgi:hypothetical protein